MRGFLTVICLVAGLALLIGCGGSGSSGGGSNPTQHTRDQIRKALGQSQMAMIQAGFQTPGAAFAMNGTSGTTGGTTGGSGGGTSTGGGGFPMIGAFVREMGSKVSPLHPSLYRHRFGPPPTTDGGGSSTTGTDASTTGTTDVGTDGSTTGGTDGGDGIYYDDYLGLWAMTQANGNEYDTLLFVDEAMTQPAGSFRTTFSNRDSYPITYESAYEITAGTFEGAHGLYDVSYTSDTDGHLSYDDHWPDSGDDQGASDWSADGWHWTYSSRTPDGTWSRYEGQFGSDGSGDTVSENSDGYKWSYHYNADGSGYGTIEGPDPGLPAKVTWTADGKYRIDYADGTYEEWDWWSFVGGGTTGSGGTSTTGVVTTTSSTSDTSTTTTTGEEGTVGTTGGPLTAGTG